MVDFNFCHFIIDLKMIRRFVGKMIFSYNFSPLIKYDPSNSIKQFYIMQNSPQLVSPKPFVELPNRPKGSHSLTFKKVDVITNHYQVKLSPLERIVIFRLRITPVIAYDNRALRVEILKKSIPSLKTFISNPVLSGMNVYSLQEGKQKECEFNCQAYKINVKQVKVYDVNSNPKVLLQFLNNGLRNVMTKLNYVEIGKTGKYFNRQNHQKIDNLMMYSGYRSSFVYLEGGYYLRVDSAKKVVRDQTVLQFIDSFYKTQQGKDKDDKRNLLRNELLNKVVMTNYGKTQYYKITDVSFKKLDQCFLDQKDVSLKQYYQKRYQLIIKNGSQPLLQVETKKARPQQGPCLLIPQLCLMTGIPDDFDQMRRKKISEATIKDPPSKMKEIEGLMNQLKTSSQIKQLAELGINVNTQMAKIQAKLISVPILQLGKNNSVDKGKQAFFNLFNKPIYDCKHSIVCGLVSFKGTDLRQLISTFDSTSKNLGVKLTHNIFQTDSSRGSVKDLQIQIAKSIDNGCNICMIVLPSYMKNDYKKLKQYALGQQEMITQVVSDATLRKKNLQSIATKVLLQIIAKRGNTLWVPKTTCEVKKTMMIAFDSAKSGGNSILSVCCSVNSTFTSFFSTSVHLESKQKMFNSMLILTLCCVKAYVDRNKQTPKDIIIFFNSCSGDQISLYHENYIKPLLNKYQEIYENKISTTIVMVNLKTSERFFLKTDTVRNVNAGTLISQNLVSNKYDFFLISQQSNKGSTVPNHYKVIFSNSNMEEGILQELCFSQCFSYVNWTGSIKVPAILQYAKKCAKFNAEVMEKIVIPDGLNNKLYFV